MDYGIDNDKIDDVLDASVEAIRTMLDRGKHEITPMLHMIILCKDTVIRSIAINTIEFHTKEFASPQARMFAYREFGKKVVDETGIPLFSILISQGEFRPLRLGDDDGLESYEGLVFDCLSIDERECGSAFKIERDADDYIHMGEIVYDFRLRGAETRPYVYKNVLLSSFYDGVREELDRKTP